MSLFSLSVDTQALGLFPESYAQARTRFTALVRELGDRAQLTEYMAPGTGPMGESLFTDVVWIGDRQASRVLVLISGTHGVESFAGSAIQSDCLTRLQHGELGLPEDTAILMVHVLNPHGFAWLRRCDEQGIDLNRNFIDFTHALPVNEGYQALRPYLMGAPMAEQQVALEAWLTEFGRESLERAISGGQYEDPQGPFFGGHAPSGSRRLIELLITQYRLNTRRLAVIDLHTGLGAYGYGEVICDHAPESAGTQVARAWFGDSVTLPIAGTSSSVPKLGLMDYAWHAIMDKHSCYVTLEFGTHSTDDLFAVLLADHWLHAQREVQAADVRSQPIKQAMRAHFNPSDDQWRELVLFRARQVIRLALHGLQQ